jgi:hypothetical protein
MFNYIRPRRRNGFRFDVGAGVIDLLFDFRETAKGISSAATPTRLR